MTLPPICLAPELDHANANTIVWMDVGEKKTPAGSVRATATCVVEIGAFHLSIEEARELANDINHAAMAAELWRDKITGRSGYVVTRTAEGVFCEHMGIKGLMRKKRFKTIRTRRCYNCSESFDALWVPVHTPWNGSNEVCAQLCDLCLNNCTVEAQRPLRAIAGGHNASASVVSEEPVR